MGTTSRYQLDRDRSYKLLLDLIIGGNIGADEPLSEQKLAKSLDIKCTAVRGALRALVRDGLLELRPALGTFVRELTANGIREIYEVRYAIEGMAAFLAATRGATEELRAYSDRFCEMINYPDRFEVTEIHDYGASFHVDIFHSACNVTLFDIYEPLRLRSRIIHRLPCHYDHERVLQSAREHLEILQGIEAADGLKSQQLMWDHLGKGLNSRIHLLERLRGCTIPLSNVVPFRR